MEPSRNQRRAIQEIKKNVKYSQRDEEEVILANAPDLGRFLEIGAFHALVFSNTRALFERGWSGALIEPSPECFIGLMKEYGEIPRIKLINALATPNSDALTKFHASPDAVGTAVEKSYDTWKNGAKFTSIYVPAIPINKIIATLGIMAEFISIDTEGTSFQILQAIQLDVVGCNLVCVEKDESTAVMSAYFESVGFKVIHETAENLIAKRVA